MNVNIPAFVTTEVNIILRHAKEVDLVLLHLQKSHLSQSQGGGGGGGGGTDRGKPSLKMIGQ